VVHRSDRLERRRGIPKRDGLAQAEAGHSQGIEPEKVFTTRGSAWLEPQVNFGISRAKNAKVAKKLEIVGAGLKPALRENEVQTNISETFMSSFENSGSAERDATAIPVTPE
jgi:hypothetical protein